MIGTETKTTTLLRTARRVALAIGLGVAAVTRVEGSEFEVRATYAEYTNVLDGGTWLRNAIIERHWAVGDSYTQPSPANGSQQEYLNALKNDVKYLLSSYVDESQASGGTFNGYFSTPSSNGIYPNAFPTWTVTGLLVHCGLPTNFFDYTPWRPLDPDATGVTNEHTYGGFTTRDYGCQGLRTLVCNLKWTANGDNSWWIMSEWWSYQSTDCVSTPATCDSSIDCSPAPTIYYSQHGAGDLTVYAECYRSRVADYKNGQPDQCHAGGLSRKHVYTAERVASGLTTNLPTSQVVFYQMNKLDDYTNFSTRCYVSGLDWDGRSDQGSTCTENRVYWTNCVWSPYGHPFQYTSTASISSSGAAYSATTFLDVSPLEYFNRSETYYCMVGTNYWSFDTSEYAARDQYTAITLHLDRWSFPHHGDE